MMFSLNDSNGSGKLREGLKLGVRVLDSHHRSLSFQARTVEVFGARLRAEAWRQFSVQLTNLPPPPPLPLEGDGLAKTLVYTSYSIWHCGDGLVDLLDSDFIPFLLNGLFQRLNRENDPPALQSLLDDTLDGLNRVKVWRV
jgi:hypothetical protein